MDMLSDPFSTDSLLAYDPDEERRKKAQADHIAAADLGKQQTQGSARKAYDPNYDPILEERRARGRKDMQAEAMDPTSPMNLFGLRDIFSPTAKSAQEAMRARAAELTQPAGGSRSIATPQPRPVPPPVKAPPEMMDAYAAQSGSSPSRSALLSQPQERAPLMFSMGGGPLKAYDPNGPDIGAPGKGGLSMQPLDNNSSFEDWQSRVANPAMFSGAMEALERPGIEAETAKNRALAKDPFLLQTMQAREKMAEKAIPEEAKSQQTQTYYENAMRISAARKAELDKLHRNPAFAKLDPQKQSAAEQDVNSQFDDQEDALDFAFHGRTRRKQGLGLS